MTVFVKNRMTANPWTVRADATIPEAIALMKDKHVRHLPVMDAGRVVGVISEGDIDSALPSKATSLSVNELTYLVNKLAIAKVMSRDPITISPDALLEQAAVVMREAKIEMLPVVEGDRLVGVITESDLLDAFIEIMGFRDHGARRKRLGENLQPFLIGSAATPLRSRKHRHLTHPSLLSALIRACLRALATYQRKAAPTG